MSENLNQNYLEKLILSQYKRDKYFNILLNDSIETRYFDNSEAGEIFSIIKNHYEKYAEIPNDEVIINSSSNTHEIKEYLKDVNNVEEIKAAYIYDKTEEWLKNVAMKYAILDSVNILENKNSNINEINKLVENALLKTLKKNIGLDYWGDLSERLKRVFSEQHKRIPSYFPQLDEYLNGGFPPNTLSIILGAIHGGKSNLMINMAVRQMLHGHNVAILSLEMAEDMVAQRVDAELSKHNINRIHTDKKTEFISALKTIDKDKCGKLFIKEFPTGTASAIDFKSYIHELKMRDIELECVYVDYLNIMNTGKSDNLYTSVKQVGEEIRALSSMIGAPIVSATQGNRESFSIPLSQIDFNHISESLGTGATADLILALGSDDESLIYENELFYKLLKNRLGGRVGEIDKFYQDDASLKMYDSTELELWIEDAKISQGNRNLANE